MSSKGNYTTDDWRRLALEDAKRIIEVIEKNNPGIELVASFHSVDSKYLNIYHKNGTSVDSILAFQGPTYYDLFRAVQSAWHTYMAMNRRYL